MASRGLPASEMSGQMFEAVFVTRWPWWAGGIGIGLLVPLLYLFLNTALGVSTGYGNIVRLLLPKSRLKWLDSPTFADRFGWRLWFMAGIVLGAFLATRLAGQNAITAEMGLLTASGMPTSAVVLLLFSGGLLLGLGARLAGGCTSGHSIHGIANLHLSSIIATIAFLLSGWLAFRLIRMLFLGGGV